MKEYIIILIISIIAMGSLMVYNVCSNTNLIEGLESSTSTSTCDDSKTLVYKNAGSIQALQDKVDQLMTQVNKLILSNDKQASSIQQIQTLDTKYDALAEKADQLALENKERLLAMAKQSKAKMDSATKQSNKMPTP